MPVSYTRLLCDIVDGDPKWSIVTEFLPDTPKDGIVIKVLYAGICHSDAHATQKGAGPGFMFPRVFGHEISGVVHDIGDDVLRENPAFQEGDNVIVYPWGRCGHCKYCTSDLCCPKAILPDRMTPPELLQLHLYGLWRDGGYQSYVTIYLARLIVKIPETIPMEVACMAPCGALTAFNACGEAKYSIERSLKVEGKSTVGVIGAGGLGLWAIQFLKLLYPNTTVVAIDVFEEKLTDAKSHGADETFRWGIKDSTESSVAKFLDTFKSYPDVFIDFSGASASLSRALSLLNVGGTLIQVGLGSQTLPPHPIVAAVLRQISIQFVNTGSLAQLNQVLQYIAENKVKPPPITLVTLAEVEKTLEALRQNKIRGRYVVKM